MSLRQMSLPPYQQFGHLRLGQFIPSHEIDYKEGVEFLGHLWVGETMMFNHFLRLESEPQVVRSIAIDFESLPLDHSIAIMAAIGLPLSQGLELSQVAARIGQPINSCVFHAAAENVEFRIGKPEYDVSCTIDHIRGLTFVVMNTPLPPIPET